MWKYSNLPHIWHQVLILLTFYTEYGILNTFNCTNCQQFMQLNWLFNFLPFLQSSPHPLNISREGLMTILLPMLYKSHEQIEFHSDFSEFQQLNSIDPSTDETSPATHRFIRFNEQRANSSGSYPATGLVCANHSQFLLEPHDRIENISFWIEGVGQFVVGLFGIVANCLAIPLLCTSGMKSLFNRLLAWLLVIHTLYIFITLTNYVGRATEDPLDGFITSFSYALYPLSHTMRHTSTYITVLMAKLRYLAVRHPLRFRNA